MVLKMFGKTYRETVVSRLSRRYEEMLSRGETPECIEWIELLKIMQAIREGLDTTKSDNVTKLFERCEFICSVALHAWKSMTDQKKIHVFHSFSRTISLLIIKINAVLLENENVVRDRITERVVELTRESVDIFDAEMKRVSPVDPLEEKIDNFSKMLDDETFSLNGKPIVVGSDGSTNLRPLDLTPELAESIKCVPGYENMKEDAFIDKNTLIEWYKRVVMKKE